MKRSELTRRTPMKRTAMEVTAKPPKGPKPKKCAVRSCRKPFVPESPFVTWCGPDCGAVLALEKLAKMKAAKAKSERAAARRKKEEGKPLAELRTEAQAALNLWIRTVRDKDLNCISCGRWHEGQWHAGHYLSRGARPGLALVEQNIAKQCSPCNLHLSGNQANFRLGLIGRIGAEAVEALEADDKPRKHTREELIALRAHYLQLVREMKKENR